MIRNKVFFSSVLVLLVMISAALVSSSLSVLFFSLFVFFLSHIYCFSIEKKNRDSGRQLLNILLIFLTLSATLHFLDTVVDYEEFAVDWRDEYKFWVISNELSRLPSISDIFKESYSNWIYGGLPGYAFYIGSIGHIAEVYFDGNNLLLQFFGSVLWSALSSIVIYKIFLLYFNKKDSFNNALTFSTLSVVFAYSFVFLRDIIIVFFYSLTFYIIVKKFTLSGLVKLLIIAFLTWQIRFEHGLFIFAFIGFYLYVRFKHYKLMLPITISVLSFVFLYLFYDMFFSAINTIEKYQTFSTVSALEVDDSIGKYIFKAPSPFKEMLMIVNSQIQPFPSWYSLSNSTNIFQVAANILPIIYSLFWFVIMFSLIKYTLFLKAYKSLSSPLKLISLIVLLFVFVISIGSGTARRIMCVYPFIYLIYCFFTKNINSKKITINTTRQAIMSYVALVSLYFILKAFL